MGLGLSPQMGLGLSAKPALEAGFFFLLRCGAGTGAGHGMDMD